MATMSALLPDVRQTAHCIPRFGFDPLRCQSFACYRSAMTQSHPIFSQKICGDAPKVASDDSAPIFPYWSFTKTVIAICALKLAASGKIDLDAPIAGEPFTLRQLLNHTAGLPLFSNGQNDGIVEFAAVKLAENGRLVSRPYRSKMLHYTRRADSVTLQCGIRTARGWWARAGFVISPLEQSATQCCKAARLQGTKAFPWTEAAYRGGDYVAFNRSRMQPSCRTVTTFADLSLILRSVFARHPQEGDFLRLFRRLT